jgi:asparagine synthase (glutamine-hydrolysing)
VLRVASQVKALLAGGDIDTAVEPAGHVGFFLWGSVPEPYTLHRGVRALPAGTTLWVQRGSARPVLHCFFDVAQELASASSATATANDAQAQFRAALEDSVRHHLLADVPVGVFLSAGLDSTSLAAMAAQVHDQPVRTLVLGFREYEGSPANEVPIAEAVAQTLGAQHTTRWVRGADFAAETDALLSAMDQPTIDGVNSYFVSKAAHDSGLKVALSGLGGDELLGGYPSFRNVPAMVRLAKPFAWLGKAFRVVSLPVLRRFTSPKYAGLFEFGGSYGGAYLLRRGLYMPWELPDVLDADLARAGWQELAPITRLDAALPSGLAPFQTVSALELTVYMRQMLLRDTDWASMAHSLEVRVPLVDIELLRTVAAIAAQNGQSPDKKTMARLAWHPKGAPDVLLERSKTGFSVPVRDWLQKSAGEQERGLRPWARFVHSRACSYAAR